MAPRAATSSPVSYVRAATRRGSDSRVSEVAERSAPAGTSIVRGKPAAGEVPEGADRAGESERAREQPASVSAAASRRTSRRRMRTFQREEASAWTRENAAAVGQETRT